MPRDWRHKRVPADLLLPASYHASDLGSKIDDYPKIKNKGIMGHGKLRQNNKQANLINIKKCKSVANLVSQQRTYIDSSGVGLPSTGSEHVHTIHSKMKIQ